MIRRRTFLGAATALGFGALAGCRTRRPSLAAGPYVQDARPDQVTVAALTEGPSRLKLRWWPLAGGTGGEVTEQTAVQAHGLVATGLTPGREYGYTVEGAEGGVVGEARFRAAPPPDASRFTFVALGDSGGTDESRGALVDALDERYQAVQGADADENQQGRVVSTILSTTSPDLVLHTGDVVYPGGSREQYAQGYFEPFAPLIAGVPVYPTLGNHDVKAQGGAPYLEAFFLPTNGPAADGRCYSFDWGPAHVTSFDTSGAPDDPTNLAWLEADLRAAAGKPWRIVTFHVPPYGASRHGDSELLTSSLVPVLERCGVDLVLNGHEHVYARFFPTAATTFVTTGGGGKSLYPVRQDPRLAYAESVFHFVEGTVDRSSLRLRAIDATGRAFDTVTLTK